MSTSGTVPMPLSCLAEQSIPANPHNSCFLPTRWQFPSGPSSDGHHRSSNGKSQNLGSNFESSGFCLLNQSKPINLTSKIPQPSIFLHSLLLHHFPQETKKFTFQTSLAQDSFQDHVPNHVFVISLSSSLREPWYYRSFRKKRNKRSIYL